MPSLRSSLTIEQDEAQNAYINTEEARTMDSNEMARTMRHSMTEVTLHYGDETMNVSVASWPDGAAILTFRGQNASYGLSLKVEELRGLAHWLDKAASEA